MDEIKVFILNVIGAVLGFLAPIQDFMVAIVILFVLNFFFGLTADMVTGGEWSWRKAFRFFTHCFVFFVLAAAVFTCGHYMHNEGGAVQCVSYMHRVVDVLYYVLTLKVVDKIPFLSEYLKKANKEEEVKDKG